MNSAPLQRGPPFTPLLSPQTPLQAFLLLSIFYRYVPRFTEEALENPKNEPETAAHRTWTLKRNARYVPRYRRPVEGPTEVATVEVDNDVETEVEVEEEKRENIGEMIEVGENEDGEYYKILKPLGICILQIY